MHHRNCRVVILLRPLRLCWVSTAHMQFRDLILKSSAILIHSSSKDVNCNKRTHNYVRRYIVLMMLLFVHRLTPMNKARSHVHLIHKPLSWRTNVSSEHSHLVNTRSSRRSLNVSGHSQIMDNSGSEHLVPVKDTWWWENKPSMRILIACESSQFVNSHLAKTRNLWKLTASEHWLVVDTHCLWSLASCENSQLANKADHKHDLTTDVSTRQSMNW